MAIANTTVFGGYTTSTVVGISKTSTELTSLQTTNTIQSNIYGQILGGVNVPGVTGINRLSTFIKTAEDPVAGGADAPTQTWYMA